MVSSGSDKNNNNMKAILNRSNPNSFVAATPCLLSPLFLLLLLISANPLANAVQYNTKNAPNAGSSSSSSASSSNPQPGPCTIIAGLSLPSVLPMPILQGLPPMPPLPPAMGSSATGHRMKCAENGYFELVQCFADYCVCVDPATGAEAISTRTSSNRLAPRCGRCQTQVARYFRDSSEFFFKPNCEQKSGNYMSKQCKDDDHCFCVNVLNGVKLSKAEAPNAEVKCEDSQFDFSIDASQVIKGEHLPTQLTAGTVGAGAMPEQQQHIPIGDPVCKLAKDAGRRCSGAGNAIAAKGVKWYFDSDTFECMAFAYNGCDGNKNRFDSVTECWDRCKLADIAGCAGMRVPATNAQGHTIICANMDPSAMQTVPGTCPSGYRCTMLAFMGVCCHSATQDLYERNYRPQCVNGARPVQMQAGGAPATLIGKTCTDEFCPSGTSCVQQEIFAHCCPTR